MLRSSTSPHEYDRILDMMATHGSIKLLYVTPERLQSTKFRKALQHSVADSLLQLIAIDEAHCAPVWGHAFRKSYLSLDYLKENYQVSVTTSFFQFYSSRALYNYYIHPFLPSSLHFLTSHHLLLVSRPYL